VIRVARRPSVGVGRRLRAAPRTQNDQECARRTECCAPVRRRSTTAAHRARPNGHASNAEQSACPRAAARRAVCG
jgi:hypothetical protein